MSPTESLNAEDAMTPAGFVRHRNTALAAGIQLGLFRLPWCH
jgi:hypothetical protein